jgi:hypothetical protein
MPEATAILEFETQHFTVRLDENQLKIDLKGSLKNDIEEALENKPILKETIGGILSIFVPLHIRLTDIESVRVMKQEKSRCTFHIVATSSFRLNSKTQRSLRTN